MVFVAVLVSKDSEVKMYVVRVGMDVYSDY